MLSFDITDKNIRIIKGTESNGKIKVLDAATIDIEDNSIENGKIVDIASVASQIGEVLKSRNMKEKTAVLSFSSNLTIFKELSIPKVSSKQFGKMVSAEMQAQLSIDDTYSMSYVIVDETKTENEGKVSTIVNILATACPTDIIDSCKHLFSSLSISLKSIMIGCNCISKIILSDIKSRLKMPLLAVQIDRNFLSINLYDESNLAFSRFTNVDPADYGFSSDYMTQAVNENIFRMLQFHKTRKDADTIENVIFYGDLDNFEDIRTAIEQMDLNVSVINVPPQVKGCDGIDFSQYANAIGALFKRDKTREKVNLLDSDVSPKSKMKSDTSYSVLLLGALGLTTAVIAGIYFSLDMQHQELEDELSSIEYNMNNGDTLEKKELFDTLSAQEEKINQYRLNISAAADAFKTHPSISNEYIQIIETEMVNAGNELGLWTQITDFSYSGYNVSLSIRTAADGDPSQSLPALIVEKLLLHPEFADVLYNGYSLSYDEFGAKIVDYELNIPLSPIELPTEAVTE